MAGMRRLADLYVVGKTVTLDDGLGDPVTVWLRTLNPVDHESSVLRANARRGRYLAVKNRRDCLEFDAVMSQIFDLDVEDLLDWIVAPELEKLREARAGQVAGDEDDLSHEDHVPAEAQQCSSSGSGPLEDDASVLRAYYRASTVEELQSRLALIIIDGQADLEWGNEFNRNKIYYCVRDATLREKRHFETLEEVDALSVEVVGALLTAYQELTDVLDSQV